MHPSNRTGTAHSRIAWVAAIVVCCSFSFAGAKEYYVAPDGKDGNEGTKNSPLSLQKANALVKAGDTVFLLGGTYYSTIQPANSGTETARITYRNNGADPVKVVGGEEYGAALETVDYITLEGIDFDGQDKTFCAVFLDHHADHITIRNCLLRNCRDPNNRGGYGIWVGRGGASHLLVENCKIYHCGTTDPKIENGSNIHIFSNSDHITIRGCDIYESYTEDGLHLGAFGLVTDVLVENCRFWGCKEDGIDIKDARRVTVRNCEFSKHKNSPTGGGAGIVIHIGANDVTVDQCRFYENEEAGVCIQYNARGDVRPVQNITVQRSVFYEQRKVGILVVGGPPPGKLKDVYLYNNVLYKNRCGIELYAHAPEGDAVHIEIKNNIFMDNGTDFETNARVKDVRRDYNNYYGAKSAIPPGEAHGLKVNPGFLDVEKRDFRLSTDSSLIDKGADVGLPFSGSAPDLGAFESGSGRP